MSELHRLVRECYRKTVASAPVPDELKRALRTSERVPKFIDNMAGEIHRLPKQYKKQIIIDTVRDFTLSFLATFQLQAEQAMMSDLAKAQVISEATALDDEPTATVEEVKHEQD